MNEPKLLSVAVFDPIKLPDKTQRGWRRVMLIELLPPAGEIPPYHTRYRKHSIRFSLYERGHIIARYTIYASCSLSDKKRALATAVYPLSVSDDPPRPPTPKEIASLGRHK